jgi:hypothetical protein
MSEPAAPIAFSSVHAVIAAAATTNVVARPASRLTIASHTVTGSSCSNRHDQRRMQQDSSLHDEQVTFRPAT